MQLTRIQWPWQVPLRGLVQGPRRQIAALQQQPPTFSLCAYIQEGGLISRAGADGGCRDEPSGDWPPACLALPL